MMSLETYRVTKSFSCSVQGVDADRYGRYWLNVDDVFQVIDQEKDENGKALFFARTPGLAYLVAFGASKLARQSAQISGDDFEFVCRQLALPMWEFGNEVTDISLPWVPED
ncbi:hypothetical protein [Lacticaseibacillus hegangensis]|uniref:Uncharacterized protein n=1 Tax=Lacticaseibacillus hegangensis TaxID=2486010 RepID=A0ABW4CYG0_9LACO|nr:hypothetical protein [Lacticaseibacillus hegangensis]